MQHDAFLPFVRDCWNMPTPTVNPALQLIAKLKRLKVKLKIWNTEVFRNVFVEIQRATGSFDQIQ